MVGGSYVSCQSALAFYGLIPEYTPAVVSVSAARPNQWLTPLGLFIFRHMKSEYIDGYQMKELDGEQSAFVATSEKALLDLVYLTPEADSSDYLSELRLQHLERLDVKQLQETAGIYHRPKIDRAAQTIENMVLSDTEGGQR